MLEKCVCSLEDVIEKRICEKSTMTEKRKEILANIFKLSGEGESYWKRMFYFMMQGIDYLHSKSLCHGDIKPQNILISKEATPKISDLGLSKKIEDACNSFSTNVLS